MEYFYPDDPYSPTSRAHLPPTAMFSFRIMLFVMALLSALMHASFIMSIWRLCGLGARSAYVVLGATALFGLGFSMSTMFGTILALIDLKWNDCIFIWLILGGVFVATELSMSFVHLYLLLQRIVCIFYPLKVTTFLGRQPILICSFLIFFFYFSVVALCLSPYAGAAYIPEHSTYKLLKKLPFSLVLLRANQVTNYGVMLTSVVAYPLLLLALKCKLKASRNSKEEMRLTSQVALSVGVEVIFFPVVGVLHCSRSFTNFYQQHLWRMVLQRSYTALFYYE